MTSKGLAARWSSVTGRIASGYAVRPTPWTPLTARSPRSSSCDPAVTTQIRLCIREGTFRSSSPITVVLAGRRVVPIHVHVDAHGARPCALSSSPESKDPSWLSSSPSPPPSSEPSALPAPPLDATAARAEPAFRLYLSVPPHCRSGRGVRRSEGLPCPQAVAPGSRIRVLQSLSTSALRSSSAPELDTTTSAAARRSSSVA